MKTRKRNPLILAAALGAFVGAVGCRATVPPAAEVETVGALAQGPSVWHAPTHASTDLTPGFQAIATDDDAPTSTVTTVTRAPDAAADAGPDGAELPEVAPKDQGLKVGEGR